MAHIQTGFPKKPDGHRNLRSGFSLIEMLIVISITAILLMIAIPTYVSLVPKMEIKSDSRAIMNTLQRARMAASNFQRLTRVLLDCTDATRQNGTPCRLESQVALYDENGHVQGWSRFNDTKTILHRNTMVKYNDSVDIGTLRSRYQSYKSLFKRFSLASGGAENIEYGVVDPTSFVVVFTPGGEAITSCPMKMEFYNASIENDNPAWLLEVVNNTGHVRLTKLDS